MAGHSHWAGIKHKKGRQDKERSKLFSKLSREITVAAKLGDSDPDSNPRLRSAIQLAKQANMPKDNINRAINKSKINNKDLYSSNHEGSYFFSNGWHIKGIYALIIGFIFSASTIWNINMNFLQSYSWLIGASMSSITYYLLVPKQNKYD